jgi:heme exporter protein A
MGFKDIRESQLPILAAQQLSCEKQDRILFQDIDFSISSGELVLLTGENGAGKTSLLRILVGLSSPNTGHVSINGHIIKKDINIATANIVYIGHKLGLSGLLSPVENLQFYMDLIGAPCHDTNEIFDVLSLLGLDGLEDLPLKHLSAGQQRRVALAKLWLNKSANLWVLDEPFTALDVATVSLLERHIENFLKQGATNKLEVSAETDSAETDSAKTNSAKTKLLDDSSVSGAVIMTSHQATSIDHHKTVFDLEFAW